jgi:predicted molibdopterin-dependent oxidoreductase YjgC
MTRVLPPAVVQIGEAISDNAGYLHNTVREPLVTCEICSTPVEGYQLCYQCRTHVQSGLAIADRVASVNDGLELTP